MSHLQVFNAKTFQGMRFKMFGKQIVAVITIIHPVFNIADVMMGELFIQFILFLLLNQYFRRLNGSKQAVQVFFIYMTESKFTGGDIRKSYPNG